MEWISVNDELPNYDFEIIVSDKHGQVSTGWYKNGNVYDLFENCNGIEYKSITHWMPMPQPPITLKQNT